jgi:hypothetical protein
MFTAKQYRAKAAEYTGLLKAASLPAETREFRRLEQSYLTLAENEEWMADNRGKIHSPGADNNWYGDAILAQQGKHTLGWHRADVATQSTAIPAKIQQLFDDAGLGGLLQTATLRRQIARFLHKHKVAPTRGVVSEAAGSQAQSPEIKVELAGLMPWRITRHKISRDNKIIRCAKDAVTQRDLCYREPRERRAGQAKPGADPSSGISLGDALRLPKRHPACRRREAQSGSRKKLTCSSHATNSRRRAASLTSFHSLRVGNAGGRLVWNVRTWPAMSRRKRLQPRGRKYRCAGEGRTAL